MKVDTLLNLVFYSPVGETNIGQNSTNKCKVAISINASKKRYGGTCCCRRGGGACGSES